MNTDSIPGQLDAINVRLDKGDVRMDRMESSITENTSLTKEIKDLMEIGRAGFKVLGWIGIAAKWIGAIAAAGASVYALFHHKPPH